MSLGLEEAARALAEQNNKITRSELKIWADLNVERQLPPSRAEELISQGKHIEAVAEMTPYERKKYGVINLYGGA